MLIAGNWKMFKTRAQTEAFFAEFRPPPGTDVVVCPPFTSIDAAVGRGVPVYAQNVHWEREGAYTGEVSAEMLAELGVKGSLVGHSERRQYFGETDHAVVLRTQAALDAGLRVIVCVGETEEQRQRGDTEAVLRAQLSMLETHRNLILAYEPVWAIGTGQTATPELAQQAHAFVKSLIDVPVLYGGSVKPDNAEELLRQPDVDGALVGGASLEVGPFTAICEAAARVAKP